MKGDAIPYDEDGPLLESKRKRKKKPSGVSNFGRLVACIQAHGRLTATGARMREWQARRIATEMRVRARLAFRLAMIATNDRDLSPDEVKRDTDNDVAFIQLCASIGARAETGRDVRASTVYAIHFTPPIGNGFGGQTDGWLVWLK